MNKKKWTGDRVRETLFVIVCGTMAVAATLLTVVGSVAVYTMLLKEAFR